jgi:hypothetical protein
VKSWQATDKEESGCASANAYREALAPEHKALLLPARVLDAEVWSGEEVEGSTTTTTSPSTNAQTPVLSANNAIIEAISSQSDALLQKLMNMDLIYLLAFGFFFLSISLGLFKMIASRI